MKKGRNKLRKFIDEGRHLPVLFALFSVFFIAMAIVRLKTGEIWRGGPPATIRLADNPRDFYSMIVFFSAMALIFLGGCAWTSAKLVRERKAHGPDI